MHEVLEQRTLAEGRWIRLRQVQYADHHGVPRTWECAERTSDRGAALIVATVRPVGEILLVRQYRPPVNALSLEFPAGLIDPGERPEDTALRELTEETGYVGDNPRVLPAGLASPGLSAEAAHFVTLDVDLARPENQAPRQQLDEGEDIRVFRVAPHRAESFLGQQRREGVWIDMRVLAAFSLPAFGHQNGPPPETDGVTP